MWQTCNELHWQWPELGRLITEDGIEVRVFEDSRRWIMHLLRQSQRRLLLRRVPPSRHDAGDIREYPGGVDYGDSRGLLRAKGRGALSECDRGFLANALAGGVHTQQRMHRARLSDRDSPLCPRCGNGEETAEHIY
eukprot:6387716-Alexandrium_andersonii.AAC.1